MEQTLAVRHSAASSSAAVKTNSAARVTVWIVALATAGALMLHPGRTLANGGPAIRTAAGGIELTKSEDIRMVKETLEISEHKVFVEYLFRNESKQRLTTLVAFPVPDPDGMGKNIMIYFHVRVNGKERNTKFAPKAVVNGRGVAMLFWDVTFPAGKETAIDIEYSPEAGFAKVDVASAKYEGTRFWDSFSEDGKGISERICLEEGTKREFENQVKEMQAKMALRGDHARRMMYRASVEYILSTARYWKGPIGEFKLRLVKDSPKEVVSVCFPGQLKEISPTVCEYTQKDFVPQDNLLVFFYTIER